jgi:hypothetical protein
MNIEPLYAPQAASVSFNPDEQEIHIQSHSGTEYHIACNDRLIIPSGPAVTDMLTHVAMGPENEVLELQRVDSDIAARFRSLAHTIEAPPEGRIMSTDLLSSELEHILEQRRFVVE